MAKLKKLKEFMKLLQISKNIHYVWKETQEDNSFSKSKGEKKKAPDMTL